MDASRADLLAQLEAYYSGCGWKVQRVDDTTVHADGPGGITWIGVAVVGEDVQDDRFAERLVDLSDRRMGSGGERCPLELLPAADCVGELRDLLGRLRLLERVSVYSLAA